MATSGDNPSLTVFGALAIGVAFVVFISMFPFSNSKPIHDNMLIDNANRMDEAQIFLSKYPNAIITVEKSDDVKGRIMGVWFSQEKKYQNEKTEQVRMFIPFNPILEEPIGYIYLDCVITYKYSFMPERVLATKPDNITETLKLLNCAK